MKLKKETIAILENFSGINQNLYVSAGSTLKTMSIAKNIFASVEIDEKFEQEFGVYNLKELLGVLSLFDDPDVEFGENSLTIKQGKNQVTYYYAKKEVLVTPQKEIKMPTPDFEFKLTNENLNALRKAASALGATDLSFVGNGTSIEAVVSDVKNATANTFSVTVGETTRSFRANFKVENLKMPPSDYLVSVSAKGLARFVNSSDYTMFVALEQNSSFDQ